MAAPADQRGRHGSAPAGEAEAQRDAALVGGEALRTAGGARAVLQRVAACVVRGAGFDAAAAARAAPLGGVWEARGASKPGSGARRIWGSCLRLSSLSFVFPGH